MAGRRKQAGLAVVAGAGHRAARAGQAPHRPHERAVAAGCVRDEAVGDSERSAALLGPLLVARLQAWLEMIEPGPVSIDIITLSDLPRRYPLTVN